jgi:hypothetical protein
MISSAYQPLSAKVATQPFLARLDPFQGIEFNGLANRCHSRRYEKR